MRTRPPSQELAIGVNMPAHIDLCRRILLGIRSVCEESGLRMHVLSDSGLVGPPKHQHRSDLPPLIGIVGHVCSREEFAPLYSYSPIVIGTSNRGQDLVQPRVINDDYAIGKIGAEYLLSLGLKRLVVLDKTSMRYSNGRRAGFLATARRNGVEATCIPFKGSLELEHISKDLLQLPPPVGLMADSDYTARRFIEQLPDYRRVIPHRIAVLGVDDDSLQNALSPISLSSVRTSGHEIGARAAEWVLNLKSGIPFPDQPVLVRPIRVVERTSTNVLAVADPVVAKAIKVIREQVGEFRDVNDLVTALGTNRRTLEIRFRKSFTRSIATELTEARLRNARHLLESTDLTISEIADLVGYSEYRLLTLAFQRLTGEPPTAYRKRVRGG